MKAKHTPALFVTLALSASALALRLELDQPGLAFPPAFPDDSRKQIQSVLEMDEAKYLGGTAINWVSTLRYAGNTQALNKFLDGLARCEGTVIHIRFADDVSQGGAWQVHHSAQDEGGRAFTIRINPAIIELSKLSIPAIRGPGHAETPQSPQEEESKNIERSEAGE